MYILCSYYMRIDITYIEIRLITQIDGERLHQRMQGSFSEIPDDDLELLAHQMIALYSNFGTNDLHEAEANNFFVSHCGRGNRFQFKSSEMITTSVYPNEILIVIEVGLWVWFEWKIWNYYLDFQCESL